LQPAGQRRDMRELLASDDPRAKEAVDLFVYRMVPLLCRFATKADLFIKW
jgi:hypothetical protein